MKKRRLSKSSVPSDKYLMYVGNTKFCDKESLAQLGWQFFCLLPIMEQFRHDSLDGHLYYTENESTVTRFLSAFIRRGSSVSKNKRREEVVREMYGSRSRLNVFKRALMDVVDCLNKGKK